MIHTLGEIKPGSTVGEKAFQLDRMIKMGLPVLPGFVLDASSWEESAWEQQLAQHLAFIPSSHYIVRSSAQGEDGSQKSFAGMFQSRLRVPPSEITSAILAIRAHGSQMAPLTPFSVIIQPWIEGTCSGVSFTRHPTRDYGSCMVTDSLPGPATAIVDGTKTPLRAFSWQTQHLVPHHFPLSKKQMEELTGYLHHMEDLLACPVDVEWTYHEGFYLLQARPMTRVPVPTIIDQEEGKIMQFYAHDETLLLIQNELEETLPRPSRASFDLLLFLFRAQGAFHRACTDLGMEFYPERVSSYFVPLLGQLYLNPHATPIKLPDGIFRTLDTSWQCHKALRTFPITFYQTTPASVEASSLSSCLHHLETGTGYAYAKISLLMRLILQQKQIPGLSLDEVWTERERWISTRPPTVPTIDLEVDQAWDWKPRTNWTKPTTVKDLYAILREDAKDELRPWLCALRTLLINRGAETLPFDQPLWEESFCTTSAETWNTLRINAVTHNIASPFTWKSLWDIRDSQRFTDRDEQTSLGVSPGMTEGCVVHPEHPTSALPPGTIVVLEALTPEWFPLLDQPIAGIITEKGSLLSHGAIQCREHHISAIFGVTNARTSFPPGTHLRLDGDRGTITLLP